MQVEPMVVETPVLEKNLTHQQHIKAQRSQRSSWGSIQASYMAKNTHNPIRKIVDGMKLTPNPQKEMIALSIGEFSVSYLFAVFGQ
jgi:hypothetical protein